MKNLFFIAYLVFVSSYSFADVVTKLTTSGGVAINPATSNNQTNGSQKTQIVDANGNIITSTTDSNGQGLDIHITGADQAAFVTTQDIFHYLTHQGRRFSLATHQTITGSGVFYVLLTTPSNTQVHFTWQAESNGPAHVHLYSGPTASGGTPYYLPNRNENSSITSSMVIASSPTVTTTGTLIAAHNLTTGKNQGGQTLGDEWIFKLGYKYLYEFINMDPQPIEMDFEFRWAEYNMP